MCGRAIFKALFAPLDALCSFVSGTKPLNKLSALLIVHGPTDFIIFAGANESLAATTLSFRIKIAYIGMVRIETVGRIAVACKGLIIIYIGLSRVIDLLIRRLRSIPRGYLSSRPLSAERTFLCAISAISKQHCTLHTNSRHL